MIGQIGHTSSIESLVNYHQKKIEQGVANILQSHKVQTHTSGQINASFRAYSYLNTDKNPYTHISLNFHPNDSDKLSDQLYKDISDKYLNYLGYDDQPFVLIKHTDQDHPHVHIITTTIKDNGNKVAKLDERYRSQNISRELELEYGLTIVPSVKQETSYHINISNKQDLKNYLKSSIKETLSYKPKRQEDFLNILKNQYQVDMHVTPSKGVSFHIFEKENGKNLQIFNDFGVKGMSGSAISKDLSFPKIKDKLQKNFKTAPKRYRNLKLSEEKLNKELNYFSKITLENANEIIESKGIKMFSENNSTYVLDTKGKNVYSSRDLKEFDFGVFSNETVLDNEKLSKLYQEISEEAFYVYKQDVSPYLKESVFVDQVALRDTYLSYLDTSETFKTYEKHLSIDQINILDKYASSYFNNKRSSIEAIAKSEELNEIKIKEIISEFASENSMPLEKLNNLMEFIDIKDQYTQYNALRNTITLIDTIQKNIKSKEDNTEKVYISPGTLFQHQRFFNRENLSEEYRLQYDKLISETYIKSAYHKIKSKYISPEDFIREFNNRGIQINIEKNEYGRESVTASFQNLESKVQIRGAKDFVLETVKSYDQKVEDNLDNIEFLKALDDDYGPAVHYLYKEGDISDELSKIYEGSNMYKEENIKGQIKELLNSKYYELKKESLVRYESDFLPYFVSNIDRFKDLLQDSHLTKEELYNEILSNFVETKSSGEYLNGVKRKEKENLDNKIKLSEKIGGHSKQLLGIRINEKGEETDYYGKYTTGNISKGDYEISKLQESPLFNFYSSVFESVSKEIFYDIQQRNLDPNGILVWQEFKTYIPDELRNDYLKAFTRDYIQYYYERLKEHNFTSNQDKVTYLNSKGIRIISSDKEGTDLKLVNYPDFTKNKVNDLIFNNVNTDIQIDFFRKYDMFNDRVFHKQVEFNNAIENGNYIGAAWLLKKNEARNLLSIKELREHGEPLQNALASITKNTYFDDVLSLSKIILEDKSEREQSNKNGNKKRRRRKRGL